VLFPFCYADNNDDALLNALLDAGGNIMLTKMRESQNQLAVNGRTVKKAMETVMMQRQEYRKTMWNALVARQRSADLVPGTLH